MDVLVKACLNGSRTRTEHPGIPLTADELAAEGQRAVAAGAGALHVHPRRPDGTESLDPTVCGLAIQRIRARCPGVPVGLSTGGWIERDASRRLVQVSAWTELPDFVSVNFSEPGVAELCQLLADRKIGVEAGLASGGDAERFVRSGLDRRCLRVLLEPGPQQAEDALSLTAEIEAILDRERITPPRLLHGEDRAAWPVLEAAVRRGYDVRIGFEDTLTLPDGRPGERNADLVEAAVALVRRGGSGTRPARP
ncbi:MAG TPA: 3-keto-5-aminohexanoate cleavage protein [bacterium]|nr:3-keto-5-aminohexanoate cleavage protein [bacterium]